jgi:YVTN family beta-propeller protein
MTYCFRPQNSPVMPEAVVQRDIDTMIAGYRPNVKAHMVCNEPSEPEFWQPQNQSRVDPATLVRLLSYARQKQQQAGLSVPLTTADIAKDAFGRGWLDPAYMKTVGLAVDIIVAHVHPYWDDECVDRAADHVMNRLNEVKAAYPGKTVVLGETGWPTAGRSRAIGCIPGNEAPSVPNQERFLRDLLPKLQATNQSAFYFEGYDEPWKAGEGGTGVGDHWGTHLVSGTCKHNVPSVMFSQLRPPGTPPPAAACQLRTVVALAPSLPGDLTAVEDGSPAARFALLQAQTARENGLAPRSDSAESIVAASAAGPMAAPAAEEETPTDATARSEDPAPGEAPVEADVPLDQPGPPAPPTSTPQPLATPTPVAPPAATPTERSVAGPSEAGGGLSAPALPTQPPVPFLPGPFAAPPPLLPPFPPLPPALPPSGPVVIISGAATAAPATPVVPLTNNVAQILSTLALNGSGPCATVVGAVCAVIGDLAGSTGRVTASMQWQIVVPAGRIPGGAIGTVVVPTTVGLETFDCPPATAGSTTCSGTTRGSGLQGGIVRVFAGNSQVAQGMITGPGPASPTPTPTVTRTSTPTATRTPVSAGLAFVANAGSANVSVFNTLTSQFMFDLPLPGGALLPLDLVINRDGTRLFTVNQDNVSVLDLTSNRPLGNISMPSGASDPIDLVLHPDGSRVYVANTGSGNVSVLDAITLQPLRTIPLPAGADVSSSIGIHPNGTRLYVSNARSANVSVLDTSTSQPLFNVPLLTGAEFPVCIAVNPAGTRVYTANLVTGSISVLDAGTNQLLATIPLPAGAEGPVHVVVSSDGTRLYTANNTTSNVSVLDATTNRPLFNIALPPGAVLPLALGLSPDGTRLYTVNESNIAVLDTVANRSLGLVALPDDPNPSAIVVR